jgi:dissimilatory sulfite reductase (desulfoviridin) alpha/beta subunit
VLLAEITGETGRNVADLTTRQQVQLRRPTIADVPEVTARLEAAGLSSLQTGIDNIRGIMGCPATGLTPRELVDTAPFAAELQRVVLGNRELTNLPRKCNVTITGRPDDCHDGRDPGHRGEARPRHQRGRRGRPLQPRRRRQAGLWRPDVRDPARRVRPALGGGRGRVRREPDL